MRVLVTGGRGQLGVALGQALAGHEMLLASRPELDVSSFSSVLAVVDAFRPDAVVHAAAQTDVDGCERDPDTAYRVNTLGTQNVALACRRVGADLVAVSTDYIFDGRKGEPYLEFDEPNPISVYGRSKLAGERLARTLHDRVYIVRPAWVFSGIGKSFVKTILGLGATRAELTIVSDELGTPTYAPDLAQAIVALLRTGRYGTYHLVNDAGSAGGCSRFELASETIRRAGLPTALRPVSSAEYLREHPLPARRPLDSRLRNFAAAEALGVRLRPWTEAVAEMVAGLVDSAGD